MRELQVQVGPGAETRTTNRANHLALGDELSRDDGAKIREMGIAADPAITVIDLHVESESATNRPARECDNAPRDRTDIRARSGGDV